MALWAWSLWWHLHTGSTRTRTQWARPRWSAWGQCQWWCLHKAERAPWSEAWMRLCETIVCGCDNCKHKKTYGLKQPTALYNCVFLYLCISKWITARVHFMPIPSWTELFCKADLNHDCSLVQKVFCGVFTLGWCQSWSEFPAQQSYSGLGHCHHFVFFLFCLFLCVFVCLFWGKGLFGFIWNNTRCFLWLSIVHGQTEKSLDFQICMCPNEFWYDFLPFVWHFW